MSLQNTKDQTPNETGNTYHCQQCKRPMNIVDYIIGVVCMKCCRENHAKVIGKR